MLRGCCTWRMAACIPNPTRPGSPPERGLYLTAGRGYVEGYGVGGRPDQTRPPILNHQENPHAGKTGSWPPYNWKSRLEKTTGTVCADGWTPSAACFPGGTGRVQRTVPLRARPGTRPDHPRPGQPGAWETWPGNPACGWFRAPCWKNTPKAASTRPWSSTPTARSRPVYRKMYPWRPMETETAARNSASSTCRGGAASGCASVMTSGSRKWPAN